MSGNHNLWQEIISFDRKSFPLTVNHFLWQDLLSFDKKSFPLTENDFLWKELISFDRKSIPLKNHFLWQKMISFDRNLFSLTGNNFLWQKIISFDKKPFIMTETNSLGHEIIHLKGNNFSSKGIFSLTGNHFLQQEIFPLHSFACIIYYEKGVTPAKYFAWGPRISWEPGSQVPREYPTLRRREREKTPLIVDT